MRWTPLAALGVLALLAGAPAVAQGGDKAPAYNVSGEIEVKGDVVAVREHAGWMGWDGVYVTLRTNDSNYEVHLAPASFLKMLDLNLVANDRLELKGCLATVDGVQVLLVREVRRQNVVINVRDPKGRPIW